MFGIQSNIWQMFSCNLSRSLLRSITPRAIQERSAVS